MDKNKRLPIIIGIWVFFLITLADVTAQWQYTTPSPWESEAWKNVRSKYDAASGWDDLQIYWAPPGYSTHSGNYPENTVGIFVHKQEFRNIRKAYVYYFSYSSTMDQWRLVQNKPTEIHLLAYTNDNNYGTTMEDYNRYGAPFNSRKNNNNGFLTIVSNYRRSNGSVKTITYQSVLEIDGHHFVRKLQ